MSGSFNRSASRLLADRVKQVVPNPGGPIGASSVVTMGAATSAEYVTFLTAFGAAKPAYFVLSDGAGKRLTGVWTVNGDGTCTITEIIGSPSTETFAQNCLAWPTIPGIEAVTVRDGPLAGFRNLIINGNPLINQRAYVSGAATSGANQYTLDRWRVVTSGQNASWTDSAGVRTVTAPAGGMEQVIEGAGLIGGTYTLSWNGTATATVGGASVTKGAQVTLTGGADVTVRMSNGTWSLLQLEPGNVATPFEFRPIAAELPLCMRYYERLTFANTSILGAIAVETNFSPPSGGLRLPFTVRKRSSPGATVSAPGHFAMAGLAISTIAFGSDASGVWGTFSLASGSLGANWTAAQLVCTNSAAWIAADAEF
jgi:hypothetical protein